MHSTYSNYSKQEVPGFGFAFYVVKDPQLVRHLRDGRVKTVQDISNLEPTGVYQNLEYIQDTFRLSLVHLADLLGLTRQAIYDWKKGTAPSEDNRHRLEVLYQAARSFKEAGLEANLATKRRWIDTELEFIQGLAYDKDPIDAVKRLIKLVERGKERLEREEWKERLKDVQPRSILEDLPYHYPGE